MPLFEIRYAKPPHAVGFDRVKCADEFDAEILGERRHGDDFISVRQIRRNDWAHAESHDMILKGAGEAPGWLKKISLAVDSTLDTVFRR